ncbi:Sua5/YciO/YrdC/YwlC family protein [Lewinella sp. IMCC34191]|uniref:Sua5/YciO/YrdC/YwlC family protein n=1 Tax=Lewinella sp. IMCC34191 TaxID=2259172 RepID=UPI000E273335|nr:Sua5/YciO/YrdC/YwlC family protein [Lewinella sp. IMCC34191]
MNIRTNFTPTVHHQLPLRGTGALSTVKSGGMVLLPTANLWQMVVDAKRPSAVNQLLQICPANRRNQPEMIFADRETLVSWFPHIHPKLDTLFVYHGRALTVRLRASAQVPISLIDKNDEVNVRLAMDSFCYRLCEDLEGPVVASFAMGVGQQNLPTRFGQINSDVLRRADFTVMRRQKETLASRPAVRVRMDGDELQFL